MVDVEIVESDQNTLPRGAAVDEDRPLTQEEKYALAAAEEEKEAQEVAKLQQLPMLVFPWTTLAWSENYDRILITVVAVIFSMSSYACDAAMTSATTWSNTTEKPYLCTGIGLLTFSACFFSLNQIQKIGNLKLLVKRTDFAMHDIKTAMARYEEENYSLRMCLRTFEGLATTLQNERVQLKEGRVQLYASTSEFNTNVNGFIQKNGVVGDTLNGIVDIVRSLENNEGSIKDQVDDLRRNLHELRELNRTIAGTYNNLVEEHEEVRESNRRMAEEIIGFEKIRQAWVQKRGMLESSLQRRQLGVARLMDGYQRGVLRQIAHDAAQLRETQGDPPVEVLELPGVMTRHRFAEFLRRIPKTLEVDFARLVLLFDRLAVNDALETKDVDFIVAEIGRGAAQERQLQDLTLAEGRNGQPAANAEAPPASVFTLRSAQASL